MQVAQLDSHSGGQLAQDASGAVQIAVHRLSSMQARFAWWLHTGGGFAPAPDGGFLNGSLQSQDFDSLKGQDQATFLQSPCTLRVVFDVPVSFSDTHFAQPSWERSYQSQQPANPSEGQRSQPGDPERLEETYTPPVSEASTHTRMSPAGFAGAEMPASRTVYQDPVCTTLHNLQAHEMQFGSPVHTYRNQGSGTNAVLRTSSRPQSCRAVFGQRTGDSCMREGRQSSVQQMRTGSKTAQVSPC